MYDFMIFASVGFVISKIFKNSLRELLSVSLLFQSSNLIKVLIKFLSGVFVSSLTVWDNVSSNGKLEKFLVSALCVALIYLPASISEKLPFVSFAYSVAVFIRFEFGFVLVSSK